MLAHPNSKMILYVLYVLLKYTLHTKAGSTVIFFSIKMTIL